MMGWQTDLSPARQAGDVARGDESCRAGHDNAADKAAMTLSKRFVGLLVCTSILGAGAGLVGTWTLGFTAFTSYSYALIKAGPLPRAAPDVSLVDQFGNERRLASLRGRYVLLHAFYGSCLTICPIVIEQIREVYSSLTAVQRNKLAIVSISIDPVRDTTERLLDLWHKEGAFAAWVMAQPADHSIDRIAQEFGVWVFAKNDGTFNHSTDLFLIDPAGRIVHVISPQSNSDRIRRDLEKYL
jgi:cytochrome oxidase Cu insertion factor (SCO1/SenC/PrrC family)